ncbi:ATP phosphoribosyltransferase regulatory subunit [Acuticoccus mangrovi]|uniref:ATP phosphoribosyltransferase regulatory subunit n=1 Tax=Acuticoccus mangrovi TaxID=2796142 RepID=A0A934ISM2_9HYPH|nr:ATP phosphoribosyltransferase regulatory subunit [Acuticoccus mangrovi]MBJ3777285.1 ATP phosphoribosyltransferase regulatory subunit [Acuticoccus mangrovi]
MSPADRLMAVLEAASEATLAPALLQPADIFVELAGEEFRKRLFVTDGVDGATLCLRPDFTIPVCLEHLATAHEAPTAYAYRGKIFRRRRAVGEPEFEQAGTEWIGHADEMATDARLFALAMACADAVELTPAVRVGDANIFGALTAALGLSATWRERLSTAFGDETRLAAALNRLALRDQPDGIAARLAPALAHVDGRQARAIVDAMIGLPPQVPAGGRTSDDIAARILELATGTGRDAATVDVIARYLEVSAPLDRAADALTAFARAEGLELDAAIALFAARVEAMVALGLNTSAVTFDARFGRRIGYYTGFVFEMLDPDRPGAEVIAGGRYDKLIALLDPKKSLPAVGFSVWLDRIPGAAR